MASASGRSANSAAISARRLEIMLGGELAAVGLGDHAALGDGRSARRAPRSPSRWRSTARWWRPAACPRVGELDQRGSVARSLGSAVALQLDVEPVAEQSLQARRSAPPPARACPATSAAIERPARPAGQRDQAVGRALEPGELARAAARSTAFRGRRASQPHQVAVAGLARGQQHDRAAAPAPRPAGRGSRVLVAEIDRQRAADDRLDAVARELLGEFQRAEQVVGVGQRQRRLLVGLGELGELADRSARLPAANRPSARADARSRGRRSRRGL